RSGSPRSPFPTGTPAGRPRERHRRGSRRARARGAIFAWGFPLTHRPARAHRKNVRPAHPNSSFGIPRTLTVTGGSTRPSVEHPPERHDEDDAGSPRGAQVEAPCPAVTCPPPLLREHAVARRPHG